MNATVIFYTYLVFLFIPLQGNLVVCVRRPNYKEIFKDIIKIVAHLPIQKALPRNFILPPMPPVNVRSFSSRASKNLFLPKIKTDVEYYLYRTPKQRVKLTQQTIHFLNNSRPTKILMHGWLEDSNTKWCKKLAEAYFKKGRYNVLAIDWNFISIEPYLASVIKSRHLGERIGRFLVQIIRRYPQVSSRKFHIIGHSMGAHLAGYVGKMVYRLTSRKLGRITALDAAGPFFDLAFITHQQKLNAQDALFVDVVHTDGGMFGFKYSMGTVDFYVNGGAGNQPGCKLFDFVTSFNDLIFLCACSHSMSHKIFLESVNSDQILAKKCESYEKLQNGRCGNYETTIFGENVPRHIKGDFYFTTNPSPPYGKIHNHKIGNLDNKLSRNNKNDRIIEISSSNVTYTNEHFTNSANIHLYYTNLKSVNISEVSSNRLIGVHKEEDYQFN